MNNEVFVFNPANQRFLKGESGSLTRNLSLFAPRWVFTIVVFLMLAGFGIAGLNIAYLNSIETQYASSFQTQGEIVSCSRPISIFHFIWIRYRYTLINIDNSLSVYEGSDSIYGKCNSETVTTPVQVRYLPLNPSSSIAVGGNANIKSAIAAGAFLFFYGIALLTGYSIALRKIRRLEQEGVILKGQIVSRSEPLWWKHKYIYAGFTFTNTSGKTIDGRQLLRTSYVEFLPTVGSPMAVVYIDDHTYQVL